MAFFLPLIPLKAWYESECNSLLYIRLNEHLESNHCLTEVSWQEDLYIYTFRSVVSRQVWYLTRRMNNHVNAESLYSARWIHQKQLREQSDSGNQQQSVSESLFPFKALPLNCFLRKQDLRSVRIDEKSLLTGRMVLLFTKSVVLNNSEVCAAKHLDVR